MTSIQAGDAVNFSESAIPDRFFLDSRPTCQFFNVLPFVPIDGHKLTINSVAAGTNGDATLAAEADAESAGGTLVTTMPDPAQIHFEIKRISTELQVDGVITGLYSSSNDILHALIRLKVEALRDHFKSLVYRGDADTNPEEFDGLRRFTTDMGTFDPVQPMRNRLAQLAGGPGSAVQRGDIEGLLAMLDPRPEPDATYLVMHSKVFEHVARQGVLDSEVIHDPDLGVLSAVAGVPILIDDFAPIDESFEATTTSSIYAVVLGENTGLCGIYPSANEGAEIQVRGPFVKDDKDRSCYHLTWDVALAGFNSGAVARLKEIAYLT